MRNVFAWDGLGYEMCVNGTFCKRTNLFPTFFLRLPLSVREEMFGNGFRARVGAEFFAASSSEFQWYCLPSAYVVLHDSMLGRCAFVHYGRLARVHACVVLKGTTCSLSLSSGMPTLPLSRNGLSSSAMTPSWPAAFGLLSPSRWPQPLVRARKHRHRNLTRAPCIL